MKEEWWNKNCPENMREVSSVQQFVDELVNNHAFSIENNIEECRQTGAGIL